VPDDLQPDVANNEDTTTSSRQLGGITGKGFMPGQSGNPSGRPKKKPLTDAYRKALSEPVAEEIRRKLNLEEGATYAEVIARALIQEAVTGKSKVSAASELADRTEGRVTQPISGPDEGPIQHEIRGMKEIRAALYGTDAPKT
jgi:hypothetical protein